MYGKYSHRLNFILLYIHEDEREKKKRKVKQTICYAPAYFSDVHFLQKM